MKLLSFLAERFFWQPFSQTLPDADPEVSADGMEEVVVIFMHIESTDQEEGREAKVFRKTLKHIKWLANKMEFRNVVLHSFAHLGGENSDPEFALTFMNALQERLEGTGYQVKQTPFGWFCSWDLQVMGESLAKVWKEF